MSVHSTIELAARGDGERGIRIIIADDEADVPAATCRPGDRLMLVSSGLENVCVLTGTTKSWSATAGLIPFVWGRTLRQGDGLATGTRPLASSVPVGTIAYATDAFFVTKSVPHPLDPTKRIWRPISLPSRQLVSVSNGATTNGRAAFYDSVANTVTHPAGVGEFCNCYVSVGSAHGAPCLISAQNYLLNCSTPANRTIGQEFMVDAGGTQLIPYVNNGTNLSLGFFGSEGSTLTGGFAQGLMWDW